MTLYQLAQRLVGEVREVRGPQADPFILWCHASCGVVTTEDEVPWCSSFLNRLAWLLRLPRSKSARARSWLTVGTPVAWSAVAVGDVVVLNRGGSPDPTVISSPGHVTLYAGPATRATHFCGLGGNQRDGVTIAEFPVADVLGVRRLTPLAPDGGGTRAPGGGG